MAQRTIKDLLIEEMQDIYDAENQLVKALPKMAQAASSPRLSQGFEMHLEETRGQVERLERAFELMEVKPKGQQCAAMKGLVQEAEELLGEKLPGEVQDAALILAAQKVEHYEIATYGSLRSLAEACGFDDVAELLEETLDEEKAADAKLTELADSEVNQKAAESLRAA